MARLTNRASSVVFNWAGRSKRLVELPITALSNRRDRARAGNENRALVAIGGRSRGGERGKLSNGSTTATKRNMKAVTAAAVPAVAMKKDRHALAGAPRLKRTIIRLL